MSCLLAAVRGVSISSRPCPSTSHAWVRSRSARAFSSNNSKLACEKCVVGSKAGLGALSPTSKRFGFLSAGLFVIHSFYQGWLQITSENSVLTKTAHAYLVELDRPGWWI